MGKLETAVQRSAEADRDDGNVDQRAPPARLARLPFGLNLTNRALYLARVAQQSKADGSQFERFDDGGGIHSNRVLWPGPTTVFFAGCSVSADRNNRQQTPKIAANFRSLRISRRWTP